MSTQPMYMDVTPLPQEVDAVTYLLEQVGQLRFDPSDPVHQALQQQAVGTYQRLLKMRGVVSFSTGDRILLYALGRLVDDPELARTFGALVDQVRQAHGQAPAAPTRSIAELAAEAATPAAASAPSAAPKRPSPARPAAADPKPPTPAEEA